MSHAGRTYVGSAPAADEHEFDLPRESAHHVARVMRAHVDDTLDLFDERGRETRARVIHIARDVVRVRVEPPGWRPGHGADVSDVTWLHGVPKGDKLESIVRQATELGVSAIRPVFTARSVPRVGGATARADRLQRAAIAACEQCGRSIPPTILPATPLEEALAALDSRIACRIVPWELGGEPLLGVLRTKPSEPMAVLVGPEGGLTRDEVDRARHHGFVPVSLGARILRTETVAPALLGIISAIRGDLALGATPPEGTRSTR